jgi:hypothetical protein
MRRPDSHRLRCGCASPRCLSVPVAFLGGCVSYAWSIWSHCRAKGAATPGFSWRFCRLLSGDNRRASRRRTASASSPLLLHRPLQHLDAIGERALHQQRIDAVGDHAKALGAEIARPLLIAGEKAWRLAVFFAFRTLQAGLTMSVLEGKADFPVASPDFSV